MLFFCILKDHNWSDTASDKDGNSAPATPSFSAANQKAVLRGLPLDPQSGAHEYHEISDEEVGESPGFDLGPSLMDEVLKALGGGGGPNSSSSHLERDSEWKEESNSQPESKRGTLKDANRKKQATVIAFLSKSLET